MSDNDQFSPQIQQNRSAMNAILQGSVLALAAKAHENPKLALDRAHVNAIKAITDFANTSKQAQHIALFQEPIEQAFHIAEQLLDRP